MRRALMLPLIAALALMGFALATSLAGAGPPNDFVPGVTIGPGDHVPICHALGNGGFQLIAPSAGVVFGHAGSSHQDGRDVIPPFVYESKKGELDLTLSGGQNWPSGMAFWANGCVAVTTTTTATTATTATVTIPPAETTVPATTTIVETTTTTPPPAATTTETFTPPVVPTTATTTTTTTTERFTPPVVPAKPTTKPPTGAVEAVTQKPQLAFTP